jgi:hypothetical protein
MTMRHVVRSAVPLLCYEGELLGRLSVGGLPVALPYAISHSERFTLSPVAFVRGAAVGDVFPFRSLPDLHFPQDGAYAFL